MTTNHQAHGPVSLDRLHQIREILSKASAQSEGGNLGYAMADAVKVIDGAIAAFGAKLDENGLLPCPLCGGGAEFDYDDDNLNWISCSACGISTDTVYHTDIDARDKLREVWNRRTAMLQAEPVSNSDELPLDYLQGHKDGLEWAAQLAKANHPETGDWLYDDPIELSKAIRKGPDMPLSDGNSPVIQDGWIKCSERMPEDEQEVLTRNRMGHCFVSFFDEHSGLFFDRVDVAAACCIEHILVTHWMPLPAAPQQEE